MLNIRFNKFVSAIVLFSLLITIIPVGIDNTVQAATKEDDILLLAAQPDSTKAISDYKVQSFNQETAGAQLPDDARTFSIDKELQTEFKIVNPGDKKYGDEDFALTTTGGKGDGAVSFSVPFDNGVLAVTNDTAKIIGVGMVKITAIKAADDNYVEEIAELELTITKTSDAPTEPPTAVPTKVPTAEPTLAPTEAPTASPVISPTGVPTVVPTASPTKTPESVASEEPTSRPTISPVSIPSSSSATTAAPSLLSQTPSASHFPYDDLGAPTNTLNLQKDTKLINRIKAAETKVVRLYSKVGNSKVIFKWDKVENADGYVIYASDCNKNYKAVRTIRNKNITTWTWNNLDNKSQVKFYLKAYRMVKGKRKYICKTWDIYVALPGSGLYTNVKTVKVSSTNVHIKKNNKMIVKASTVKTEKKKALLGHVKELRYLTNNSMIASVDSKGRIKGRNTGECYIYVYAGNGMSRLIKVTVK